MRFKTRPQSARSSQKSVPCSFLFLRTSALGIIGQIAASVISIRFPHRPQATAGGFEESGCFMMLEVSNLWLLLTTRHSFFIYRYGICTTSMFDALPVHCGGRKQFNLSTISWHFCQIYHSSASSPSASRPHLQALSFVGTAFWKLAGVWRWDEMCPTLSRTLHSSCYGWGHILCTKIRVIYRRYQHAKPVKYRGTSSWKNP